MPFFSNFTNFYGFFKHRTIRLDLETRAQIVRIEYNEVIQEMREDYEDRGEIIFRSSLLMSDFFSFSLFLIVVKDNISTF